MLCNLTKKVSYVRTALSIQLQQDWRSQPAASQLAVRASQLAAAVVPLRNPRGAAPRLSAAPADAAPRALKRLQPLDNVERLEDDETTVNAAQLKKMLYTDCAALQGVYWAQAQRPALSGPALEAALVGLAQLRGVRLGSPRL